MSSEQKSLADVLECMADAARNGTLTACAVVVQLEDPGGETVTTITDFTVTDGEGGNYVAFRDGAVRLFSSTALYFSQQDAGDGDPDWPCFVHSEVTDAIG